ncbi:Sec7-domain-containing protein [Neoconidiobolus thromboides FSU 785]|nr:Sec7-domain-containing protein [Neoconidiobolus thromboides FSU 785]
MESNNEKINTMEDNSLMEKNIKAEEKAPLISSREAIESSIAPLVSNVTPLKSAEQSNIEEEDQPIGSSETLKNLKHSINTYPSDKWKKTIDFSIIELIVQLLSYHRYKPSSNNLGNIYSNILHGSFSKEGKEEGKEEGEKGGLESNKVYSSNLNHFGKLGKLIGTQVFEFEQWDEYEFINPPKIPEILQTLIDLRLLINQAKDIQQIDGLALLTPFMDIIKNPDTSGSLTGVALSGIESFLTSNILNPITPNISQALKQLTESIISCKFEAGESGTDDITILKIVQVMELLLKDEYLILYLSIKEVKSILKAVINLACQLKLSKILRYQSEILIKNMIYNIVKIVLNENEKLAVVFQFIITLLEPHSTQHSNYMRLLGLNIFNDILLKYGQALFKITSLSDMFCDQLSGYLWMLLESEHLGIITKTLNLISILISTAQYQLKQQQLMWIQQILNRINKLETSPLHTGSYRQIKDDDLSFLLTNFLLNHINQHPSLINELFINFDCCLNQPDLAIDVMSFLIESATKFGQNVNSVKSHKANIWLDQIKKILLNFIMITEIKPENEILSKLTGINDLLKSASFSSMNSNKIDEEYCSTASIEELLQIQSKKKVIREAIELFNQKPWKGLDYLIEHGLLPPKDSPTFNRLASRFLLTTSGINKKELGEFVSKKSNFELLKVFISEFNFTNKRIDEAMREFLEAFRLPGEAQLIARIFEEFSEHYFKTEPPHIKSKDGVFVLAYSIILVNTDLHNNQVRKKMQFADYARNLRGVNDGQDFDQDFLKTIYTTIQSNEIVMPEEQNGRISLEYNWKVTTQNPNLKKKYLLCQPNQYNKEVFLYLSNILVEFYIQSLTNSTSDLILQDSLQGLYIILLLSNHYKSSEVTDYVIRRMIMLTGSIYAHHDPTIGLDKSIENEDIASQPRALSTNRIQQVDNQILSDLSLSLGQSYKSQIITIFLMNIFNEMPKSLFNGWWDMLDIIRNFIDSFLLSTNTIKIPDLEIKDEFTNSFTQIPFKPQLNSQLRNLNRRQLNSSLSDNNSNQHNNNSYFNEHYNNNEDKKSDIILTEGNNGLFSTLSSYLGYSNQYPDLIWDLSPQVLFSHLESVKKIVPICNFEDALDILTKIDEDNFETVLKRIMIVVKVQHAVTEEGSNEELVINNNKEDMEREVDNELSTLTSTAASMIHHRPDTPNSINSIKTNNNNNNNSKRVDKYFPSTAFFFHWIVHATALREDSNNYWSLVISFLGDIFYHADFYHPYLIKRAVIEILLILVHFFRLDSTIHYDDSCCIKILEIIASLSPTVIEIAAHPLLAAFKFISLANMDVFKNTTYWTTCLQVLQVTVNQDDTLLIKESFNLLRNLALTMKFVQIQHTDFLVLVNLLVEFSNPDRFVLSSGDNIQPIIERSLLAIQDLATLVVRCNPQEKGTTNLDNRYFLPPLIGLSTLSNHRRKEIRNQSFYLLKRSIMSQELFSSEYHHTIKEWEPIFERVLFPLAEKSLEVNVKRKLYDGDESVEDRRSRVTSLIASLFLHFISTCLLKNENGENGENNSELTNEMYTNFTPLWMQVIDFLLRLVKHPENESLYLEAIMENLKNLLLVLMSTNLLLPPSGIEREDGKKVEMIEGLEDKRQKMSTHTWNLIMESLPIAVEQLFPKKNTPPLAKVEEVPKESNESEIKPEIIVDPVPAKEVMPEIVIDKKEVDNIQEFKLEENKEIEVPELNIESSDNKNEENNKDIKMEKEDSNSGIEVSPSALAYGYL